MTLATLRIAAFAVRVLLDAPGTARARPELVLALTELRAEIANAEKDMEGIVNEP